MNSIGVLITMYASIALIVLSIAGIEWGSLLDATYPGVKEDRRNYAIVMALSPVWPLLLLRFLWNVPIRTIRDVFPVWVSDLRGDS